jgi:hypothetical protein
VKGNSNLSPNTKPVPIADLFEAHLTVSNLGQAIAFYRDTLALAVAQVFTSPKVAFFWIGAPGKAMLGLWETGAIHRDEQSCGFPRSTGHAIPLAAGRSRGIGFRGPSDERTLGPCLDAGHSGPHPRSVRQLARVHQHAARTSQTGAWGYFLE